MRRYIVAVSAVVLLLVVIGLAVGVEKNKIPDQARIALEQAERFELFSLNPEHLQEAPPDAFHGWEVLGKTVVKDAKVRIELVAAFKKGVGENDGTAAACFDPRHGIRVTHNGKTVSFVICFECLQVQVYSDDERQPGVLITDSPEPVFDRVLKQAGVPLAEKSE